MPVVPAGEVFLTGAGARGAGGCGEDVSCGGVVGDCVAGVDCLIIGCATVGFCGGNGGCAGGVGGFAVDFCEGIGGCGTTDGDGCID